MMASSVETALLRLEEVFAATLARMDTLLLQPLLSAEAQPSEHLQLVQRLQESARGLREVTDRSLRSLRHRLRRPSGSLKTLLLLNGADQVLKAYVEYIDSYTNCVVSPAFEKAIKRRSEYWRGQSKALRQTLAGVSPEGPPAAMLAQALCQPLTQHVQQYLIHLLCLSDRLEEGHPHRALVTKAIGLFGDLQLFMRQALDQAAATQSLWPTLSGRPRDALCTPARRLLLDSQDVPVTVTPLRADRVLLFDDVLVLLQGHGVQAFDLKLVWVDSRQDECGCSIVTPEEEFSLRARGPEGQETWRWKAVAAVRQALRGKKDFPVLGTGLEPAAPPAPPAPRRRGAHTFRREGALCGATYEGDWRWGRPHGNGTLKWPDGRNHAGEFRGGLEHGLGIRLLPAGAEDAFDCYKCHWREGRMRGYGVCEYSTGEIYRGHVEAGLRHGFGVLESEPHAPRGFKYTGHWEGGQRNGFGVQDDAGRGERYIGMWLADRRHGPGIVVTQAGVCYEGTFQMDKMVGPGVLLFEDDSLYEGAVTRDLKPTGKGTFTFPNGFVLEGLLSNGPGGGLSTQGVLDTSALPPDPSHTWKRQLGVDAFPREHRWHGVFDPFWAFVGEGCPGELLEAVLGFHVHRLKELRGPQEGLCCQRGGPEDGAGAMNRVLEEILHHREPEALQPFLRKALSDARHPLGKLLRALALTFQAAFTGVGANKHLQGLACDEVKQHARGLWAAYRALLRVALESKGQALEEEDEDTRNQQVHGVMLPLVLPSFYSELFTLYLLLHEREDSLYSQGFTHLSLLPDAKLLEFLNVRKRFWPLSDIKLTSEQSSSPAGDACFLSATRCLQKILTTVDPRAKLEVLEGTFREVEATVTRLLGREHKLAMDDFLPLLIYVVSRARIQHLGAELHLLRDMMEPGHAGGLHDFLLTALESCYEHIQKDYIRLHRLPARWDSTKLW
ncbi:LOW QUALITY PROTEIN: ALS2 C-terminal-like protein [Perognathus longimembris pacificus]|uniref:LOW QUALITY PROTEIN: ALS2 C-terminal-like protein n=1 Tax=Perognathus longimembris pacificus TaxID=214514 RepID=UPI002019EEAD|nr:LOW QUALITY PROTEIN: ALS2 C-terminal-like protein [Perognathus longimembris pacificus]